MGSRGSIRRLALLALAAWAAMVTPGAAADSVLSPQSSVLDLAAAVAGGQADGLALDGDGNLRLAPDAPVAAGEAPFTRLGTLVGPPRALTEPAGAVDANWSGAAPPGTGLRLEVRGRRADGRYSEWEEVPGWGGRVTLPWPAAAVQCRLTLLAADSPATPLVRAIVLRPATASEPVVSRAAASTMRVYASRIGLIGGTTANGHVIAAGDRFVALPSRRVLAARGGTEYQVRVEYRGSNLTLPVWDVGPWNVRDNYWAAGAQREMWNDVTPGQPQAAAAYYELHNGGRDGFGRRVLTPAGVDLSDGAYEALGLTQPDWVTVTFLWLGAGG